MSNVALLFVGAVLLVNGLVFLGRVDGRAAIPINLLAGSTLVLTALLLVASVEPDSPTSATTTFGAVGFALFGFTYLTVALNSLLGGSGSALGWYCGWAAIIATVLAMINFSDGAAPQMGWLWASWALLFISFFLALIVPGAWWTPSAGILAILQGFTTATIPALVMIGGSWDTTSLVVIGMVQISVAAIYVASVFFFRNREETGSSESAGSVAVSL